eukprot:10773621-Prorocentrum_lima.AAC.1
MPRTQRRSRGGRACGSSPIDGHCLPGSLLSPRDRQGLRSGAVGLEAACHLALLPDARRLL